MKPLVPHQFATLIEKMMPESEIKELADRIKECGLIEKGKLFQGMILDGRHRNRACEIAGVKMEWEDFKGSERDAFEYVINRNFARRQMNAGQRAMAIAAIERVRENRKWTEKQKVQTQVSESKEDNTTSIGVTTVLEQAKAVHVSPRSVDRARHITKSGTPALVKMAAKGEVGLIAAESVAKLPKRTQQKIVALGPKAVVEAASDARDFSGAYSSKPAPGLRKGSTMTTMAEKLIPAEVKIKYAKQQADWAAFFVQRMEDCYAEHKTRWRGRKARYIVDALIEAVRA